MIENIPVWTDVMQAFAAVIGVPLTVFTLYKLVKKDEERQVEIKNLTVIADQLTNMQLESEKRYKSSKKPNIIISLKSSEYKKSLKLNFKNINTNTSIISFSLANGAEIMNLDVGRSGIVYNEGNQTFFIDFNYNSKPIDILRLNINYSTEEGYIFIQDVVVWKENGEYVLSPGAIINNSNSIII